MSEPLDPGKFRAEWRRAPDFQEFAEALGCRTDQVFTVVDPKKKGLIVVLATLDDENEELLYTAVLKRDKDGIFRVVKPPEPKPGMWEKIQEDAEKIRQQEEDN